MFYNVTLETSQNVANITITNGAAWSIEFYTNGGYFDTRKKSLETRSEAERF